MTTLGDVYVRLFESKICGVRNSADGHQAVRAFDDTTIGESDLNVIATVNHLGCARLRIDVHAAASENIFDQLCRVLIFAGQNHVARRNQTHLATEPVERRGKFGAGHS